MTITRNKELDIFVGSNIGSLKHIKYHSERTKNNKRCIENLIDIKSLQKDEGITCMQWGNKEQTEILLGKNNQQLEIYSTNDRQVTWRYNEPWDEGEAGAGPVIGAGRCAGTLVGAVAGGAVRVWGEGGDDLRPNAGSLKVLRVCPDEAMYATGGEENELRVWDLESGKTTFTAKNPPHDWLQLRRPTSVGGVAYTPGCGGAVLAVCSNKGYVRVYDTRVQRRPVVDVALERAAVCIAQGDSVHEYVVGMSRGGIVTLDTRAGPGQGKLGGKLGRQYAGAAGAVTDVHVANNTMYTVSLDRHLRVYNVGDKEMVYQQYLTSKLRAVLVQTESSTPLLNASEVKEEKDETEVLEVPDDLDDIFDTMETIGDKPNKKKLEIIEDTPAKKNKPSTEGSTADTSEDAIVQLLRSTEKLKRKREKMKKEKRAKSVYHNA